MGVRQLSDKLRADLQRAAADFLVSQANGGVPELRSLFRNPEPDQVVVIVDNTDQAVAYYVWNNNSTLTDDGLDVVSIPTQSIGRWIRFPDKQVDSLQSQVDQNTADILDINTNHVANTSNPHSVTAAQVGAYTTTQVDALVDASLVPPEAYDPTVTGNYPTTFGGGAIDGGHAFRITADLASIGDGARSVNIEDLLIALVDNPSATVSTDWMVAESNRDQATETVKGVAELATQAEVDAGTDDARIVTPLKLATWIPNVLDPIYVNLTGDTMTGELVINTGVGTGGLVIYQGGIDALELRAKDAATNQIGLDLRDETDTRMARVVRNVNTGGNEGLFLENPRSDGPGTAGLVLGFGAEGINSIQSKGHGYGAILGPVLLNFRSGQAATGILDNGAGRTIVTNGPIQFDGGNPLGPQISRWRMARPATGAYQLRIPSSLTRDDIIAMVFTPDPSNAMTASWEWVNTTTIQCNLRLASNGNLAVAPLSVTIFGT